MACVLALWRLAADLGDTSQFPITNGLFSHWQVWFAAAGMVQFVAMVLNRYGKAEAVLPDGVDSGEHKLASSRY